MIDLQEGIIVEGQIEFFTNGSACLNKEGAEVFIYKKNTGAAFHLDKVKIELFEHNGKVEGRVVEVTNRFKTQFVGKAQVKKNSSGNYTTFVIPDSNKLFVDFYIKGNTAAKDGEKVVVEFLNWKEKSPVAKIVKVLGTSGDNNTEMHSIMHEYGLPMEFPKDVLIESENVPEVITKEEIAKRRDMRNITTFTIDPLDAKDFDDALSIRTVDSNIEVGVHIADVSHYVVPGSKLDDEAYKRATSVYLVDRCVPMLPERLSNGICSLKPNVDRLAFSVIFVLDNNGEIISQWQGKTVIHSDRRFTYEEAQTRIEEGNGDYVTEIQVLNSLAKKIRAKRISNGSLEMGGVEVKFKLDEAKKPIGVYFKTQKDANKLIEEFMLLANKSIAKTLSDAQYTNVYRIHDSPNIDKLNSLASVCEAFGHNVSFDSDGAELKKTLNQLLKDIKNTPEENLIGTLVTRCMSKATYTIKNIGHYGLGFEFYSHFTSPIRRYPDLITHRVLMTYLAKNAQGNPAIIEEQAKWCSARELVASKAERDSIKYKQAEYLLDKIGCEFEGIVSGITDFGVYVELLDSKCEGMIRYSTLEEHWEVDKKLYLIKSPSGEIIRLGDPINIIISNVDIEKKQIDFTKV